MRKVSPTSLWKERNATGFTRLRQGFGVASIALGRDLVSGAVDVLGTQLEEEELLSGRAQPSGAEKALLDRELEDFMRDPTSGSSWEEVKSRLKL